MRISVVIPTYNSGSVLVEALDSVLSQTRPADQIIVVDDGSTDDTSERIMPYLDKIEYLRQSNARVAAARNAGISRATGDVVAFLDADDVWHPLKLQSQAAVLDREADIGLLATGLEPWPGTLSSAANHGPAEIEEVPLARLLVFNCLATSSIVVRRCVLDQIGPFDTQLFGPEDYDLWLRATRVARTAILKQPLIGYRDTAGSLGKQAETMRRGLVRIHAKLDAAGAWPSRTLRRKCRAHVDYTTGYMYLAAGQPSMAARLVAQSLVTFPAPMLSTEVRYRFARPRLLARSAWAACRQWLRNRFGFAAGPQHNAATLEASS